MNIYMKRSKRRVSKKRVSRRVSQKRVSRRVSQKRVSRRVSQRRVSQKRVSQRRVSQKRVSRKQSRRVSQKRVSRRVSQKRVSRKQSRRVSKKRVSRRKNVFFKMIDGHMIVDPPISDKRHQGSCAIEKDHYFSYVGTENFLRFFQKVKNKFPKNLLCFPELTGPTGTRRDYQILIEHVSYVYAKNKYPNATENNRHLFVKQHLPLLHTKVLSVTKEIKSCIKKGFRFICLDVDLRLAVGGHANIILIDTKQKTIELFEPHGGKDKQESGWYKDISSIFQDYFEHEFPNYTYVPPHKIMGVSGPQGRKPVTGINNGLCMSWCSLYLHYKLLNPEIPSKVIVKRLIQLNQTFLRKYLQYVEDVIKGKEKDFQIYRRAESHQPRKKQIMDDIQVKTIQKAEDPKKSQSV
jgi:hypothetical protein